MPKVGSVNSSGYPIGSLIPLNLDPLPFGFLVCDGSVVSRSAYYLLYAKLKTAFGIGDGATTFRIPDMRGAWARAFDPTNGSYDPDVALRQGMFGPSLQSITGTITDTSDLITQLTSTENLTQYKQIYSAAFPAGSYIQAIIDATTVQINVPATMDIPLTLIDFDEYVTLTYGIGTVQPSGLYAHTHFFDYTGAHAHATGSYYGAGGNIFHGHSGSGAFIPAFPVGSGTSADGSHGHTLSPSQGPTGNETRSKNAGVVWGIAYI